MKLSFVRCSDLPIRDPPSYSLDRRLKLVMDKTEELLSDHIFKGHKANGCPLLWSKRKWKSFLIEKVEEALPLVRHHAHMNLPPDAKL